MTSRLDRFEVRAELARLPERADVYMRLERYAEAEADLRRYLDQAPPDAARRREVSDKLELLQALPRKP